MEYFRAISRRAFWAFADELVLMVSMATQEEKVTTDLSASGFAAVGSVRLVTSAVKRSETRAQPPTFGDEPAVTVAAFRAS